MSWLVDGLVACWEEASENYEERWKAMSPAEQEEEMRKASWTALLVFGIVVIGAFVLGNFLR